MRTHYRQISLVLVNMSSRLAIPIYVDTNALSDILASIEDGFPMSDNVTAYSSDSKNIQLSGGLVEDSLFYLDRNGIWKERVESRKKLRET